MVVGPIVFVSGHGRDLPALPGVKHAGKLGKDVTIEEGYATSRAAALSILASLKAELSDLDRIKRLVRLFGMVNVAPGFDRMPQVIDGASDFFYELLGPKMGQHARSAVGLAELPHGIPSRSMASSKSILEPERSGSIRGRCLPCRPRRNGA